MLQENFQSQKNQNQATDKFRLTFVPASKKVSNDHTDDRENHSGDSDNCDRFNNWSVQEGKCDSYCKCIDTGCNSQN